MQSPIFHWYNGRAELNRNWYFILPWPWSLKHALAAFNQITPYNSDRSGLSQNDFLYSAQDAN